MHFVATKQTHYRVIKRSDTLKVKPTMKTYTTPSFSLLLSILMVALHPWKITLASQRAQAEALVKWKNSISSSTDPLNSWSLNSTETLCSWDSIVCDDSTGEVTGIDLSELNLEGTLDEFDFAQFVNVTEFSVHDNNFGGKVPAGIGKLSRLERLDLGLNYFEDSDWSRFTGMKSLSYLDLNLNSFKSKFPAFIPNCVSLNYLDLSQNEFTGPIPESVFTNLINLETLNLTNNKFSGPLSSNISKLSKLRYLRLPINPFGGRIPPEIGLISGLEQLELYENSFRGAIPASIGKLSSLSTLDLHKNFLNSSIPSELGLCSKLTYLALAENHLSGELPLSLLNLKNIVDLGLSDNSLSGPIHSVLISNWTALTSLQLQNNRFNGKLPTEIGLLTNLTVLFLYQNNLTGPIPSTIGNLKKLERFDLSVNQLSGPIPKSLWNLTNLIDVQLFYNGLEGTIPPEIGNLASLKTFDVNTNELSGELPDTISSLTNLTGFSVFSNNFSGTVPKDFGKNSPKLVYVSFSNNTFTGKLPPDLCSSFALATLTVNNNSFTGPLPECLRNCSGLKRIRLDENNFTANITASFGVHPLLDVIYLNDNKFVGRLSPNWGNCVNITDMQMGRNKISGGIPSELGKLTLLGKLQLNSNELSGEIPSQLGELNKLYLLDLSSNRLSSEIPSSLSDLSDLEILDLSGNNLSGAVPKWIGQYQKLRSLDLSHNELSGEIPAELGNLVSLQVMLNLSSNSLSGEIPSNLVKLSRLENFNVSDNSLSGKFPMFFAKMTTLQSADFSYNNLSGTVPDSAVFRNSFLGNPNLCGNSEGLRSCSSEDGKKSSDKKTKILIGVLAPVSALLILLSVAFIVVSLRRKSRTYDVEKRSEKFDGPESLIWETEAKFTFREITKATNDFDEKYCIGKGGFGSVYKAVLMSGIATAVKKLNTSDSYEIPKANRKSFESEIKTLTEVRHRNIIKLYGFCSKNGCMYLVYEYIRRGSLAKVLYGLESEELDWGTRMKIVQGLAHALSYLHHDCSPAIVHRDVSLNNVLLDADFEPKLSDFGTARLLSPESSVWTNVAGSYGYMAPELAQTMKVTEKCDVYGFGIVALEVMMGRHPGETIESLKNVSRASSNEAGMLVKDALDQRLEGPTGELAEEVVFFVTMGLMCVRTNPDGRPTMRFVAQELSARTQPYLPHPFASITMNKLTGYQK